LCSIIGVLVRHRILSISLAVAVFVAGMARKDGLLASVAMAVGLGVVVGFGLKALDDTIQKPEDITGKLHLPLLGQLPLAGRNQPPVISGQVPPDFREACRALGASLAPPDAAGATRFIVVTSAEPLEGKTTISCNLSLALAATGSRVLLIDANFERPGVGKALGVDGTVGLSQVLMGQSRIRDAIQRTADTNLCVMSTGPTPTSSSELVSSERMKQLITNLKQGPFDWVLIDTPAVLTIGDAAVLTPLVDAVTFVVRAGTTRLETAERALEIVSRSKINGAVLNRVKRTTPS